MALSKSRPTLQTLDDRIVPDATPLPGLPDGPPTGPPSYSAPSTGQGSYDYGSYGNNSYTAPSTGQGSYDYTAASVSGSGSYSLLFDSGSGSGSGSSGNNSYTAPSGEASYYSGLFGNNSSTGVGTSGVGDTLTGIGTGPFGDGYTPTGNNSYVLTAASGSGTGPDSPPLFSTGSGSGSSSSGNNPYSAMSTGIMSYIPPPAIIDTPDPLMMPVVFTTLPTAPTVPPALTELEARLAAIDARLAAITPLVAGLDSKIAALDQKTKPLKDAADLATAETFKRTEQTKADIAANKSEATIQARRNLEDIAYAREVDAVKAVEANRKDLESRNDELTQLKQEQENLICERASIEQDIKDLKSKPGS